MKRKAIILFTLILIVMVNVCGCEKKQKTNVLTNDVKKEITMQGNEIKKFIKDGTSFLNAGKYDDAKSSFEKAISKDKANKGAYIQIKNKYMEKQRVDDAYYFIKLAISNSVDTENMKKLLKDIKSKFQVVKLYESVYQNNKYRLPDRIKVKINNQDKEVGVVWNNNSVDTSKVGNIKYVGKIKQYDRIAELNLRVIEAPKETKKEIKKEIKKENNTQKVKNIQDKNKNKKVKDGKQIGFINEIYEQNGKIHLKFDDVEFFHNKDINDRTAEREVIKDGKKYLLLDGRVTDDYYFRNKDNSLKAYEISPNVEIDICKYHHLDKNINTIDLQRISYEKFKTLGNVYGQNNALFYIYVENNIIVKIQEQFRP